MKLLRILPVILASLGLLSLCHASETAKASPTKSSDARVEVIFQDPDKFSDVKDSAMGTDSGREAILEEIKTFVEREATLVLPAGQRITITFTDIDLAGEYEPWRSASAMDIRIVKDIYPPKFQFTYKISDEKTGAVIKEGKELLRDLAFMNRLVIDRNDPLRFEKDMLRDWIRSELRAPKK